MKGYSEGGEVWHRAKGKGWGGGGGTGSVWSYEDDGIIHKDLTLILRFMEQSGLAGG